MQHSPIDRPFLRRPVVFAPWIVVVLVDRSNTYVGYGGSVRAKEIMVAMVVRHRLMHVDPLLNARRLDRQRM
jgi:hypothetical protein